jgi:hypothetical protein
LEDYECRKIIEVPDYEKKQTEQEGPVRCVSEAESNSFTNMKPRERRLKSANSVELPFHITKSKKNSPD